MNNTIQDCLNQIPSSQCIATKKLISRVKNYVRVKKCECKPNKRCWKCIFNEELMLIEIDKR